MTTRIRTLFLHACKAAGLFALSARLYPQRLRILCYHGFALEDEHRFRPGLFISKEVFARRLAWLARHRFNVLPFDEAVRRLRVGQLPPRAVALTIDDGFYSTCRIAQPLLAAHGFPAIVYVTSYYVEHPNPIFRLAVQYMLWKSECAHVSLAGLLPEGGEAWATKGSEARPTIDAIVRYAESSLSEPERVAFARALAARLGVDYARIADSRMLSLCTREELGVLERGGVRVEMHTHRHHLPDSDGGIDQEITDNRRLLEPLTARRLRHFCYPSGVWSESRWHKLKAHGIETATTCEPGLNSSATPPLALHRLVDRDNFPQIDFEAELFGFKELLRDLRRVLRLRRRESRRTSAVAQRSESPGC